MASTAPECVACGADFSGDGGKPNPFEPPRAPLGVARRRGPLPAVARYAVVLIWVTAALSVAFAIVRFETFASFAGEMVGVGILAFFAWAISTGRNWSRWVFAVLIGLWAALFILFTLTYNEAVGPPIPWGVRAFNILQNLLQVAATVLLFLPKSNEWFAADEP